MRIRHLFISEGHNFFGHHGGPAGTHPVVAVDRVECVPGAGIRGDRFFGYRPDYKGQVTFFAWEVFEGLRQELGRPDAEVGGLRRNIVTEGVELGALIGQPFEVQGVSFRGIEECRPCHWMDGVFGAGAEAWLRGRGGLRAQVVSNGWVVREEAASQPAGALAADRRRLTTLAGK